MVIAFGSSTRNARRAAGGLTPPAAGRCNEPIIVLSEGYLGLPAPGIVSAGDPTSLSTIRRCTRCDQVIPKGPADEILEPGDVVIRMNGELITTFLPWESYLDDAVRGQVEVQVQRGGREIKSMITVG